MEFKKTLDINNSIMDTIMIWKPEELALATGEICVSIKGVPSPKETITNNSYDLLSLIPICSNRSKNRSAYQNKYHEMIKKSLNDYGIWEREFNNMYISVQYFFRIEKRIEFEIPNDKNKIKSIFDFLFVNTIYSKKNLEGYLKPGRKIQIMVGRTYKLPSKLNINWNVNRTSFSNLYIKPRSFSGIPSEYSFPQTLELIDIKSTLDYESILNEYKKMAQQVIKTKSLISQSTSESPKDILNVSPLSSEKDQILELAKRVDKELKSKHNFRYSETFRLILKKISMFLIGEKKSIILIGKPGTGKSIIAEAFANCANDMGLISGHTFTTATSNWSSYETIGGYALDNNGLLKFRFGVISEVLNKVDGKEWIIIDEINRANIDKAFGALFSVLEGKNVILFEKEQRNSIMQHVELPAFLPEGPTRNFRIIGTMNSSDKASLFQLSYAFKRRFIFINIDYSWFDIKDLRDHLILKYFPSELEDINSLKIISEFWNPEFLSELPLGPSLMIDFIKTARNLKDLGGFSNNSKYIEECFELFIFDNLDVITESEIVQIKSLLDELYKICDFSLDFESKFEKFLEESS